MRVVRITFLLLVALPVLTVSAWAQSSTTSLRGTVQDPGGAVINGATVTLSNPQTGFSRSTKTDNQGAYQFAQVPPATYEVTTEATGFAPLKREGVVLLVNTPATLNVTVQLKGESVTLEVTGEAAAVNTTDATVGNTFDNRQVLNLPFEGRNPAEILSLQPGVSYVGKLVNDNIDTRNGAVNGGRSDQANITLDGVDNNDIARGQAFTGAVRSTLDSVEEFRVTTGGANADQGRSSGGQVALVTKSGTNQFHGSLYEYNRPTITAANDWFNKQAQSLEVPPRNRAGKVIRNTYGGALGGPILKNRLFFFGTYEAGRLAESAQVTRAVPADTLRAGSLAYPNASGGVTTLTAAQIASMDTKCAGLGTCPLGPGPNPAVVQLFNQYPRANSSNCPTADGFNFACFTFSAPTPQHLNTSIFKLDYNLNSSGTQHVFLRANYQEDKSSDPPQFPGQPPALVKRDNSRGLAASYSVAFSNNLINNFRYGFTRMSRSQGGSPQTAPQVEIRFIDDLVPLTLNSSTTSPSSFARVFHIPSHNWADDLTWTRGAHTFQFGANIRLINNIRTSDATSFNGALVNPFYLLSTPSNSSGSLNPSNFGFPAPDPNNPSVYDSAMIDLVGIIDQVTGAYNFTKNGDVLAQGQAVGRHFRSWETEVYAQDAWRVKPNLTITAGLRYTILEPPYETNGNQATPNFSMHDFVSKRGQMMLQGQAFEPIISFDLSGQANGKQPYWPYDYKDFGPRVAFAYSPNFDGGWLHKLFGSSGKSSIRGGYGIVYDHFGEGVASTFDQAGTFGLTTAISNPASVQTIDGGARLVDINTIPVSSHDGLLLNPPPPAQFPATPPTSTVGNSFQQIAFGFDDKLKTPYSHVMDLSITRELPGGFVIEADYIGRLGRRLLQQRDMAMPLNLVDPTSKMDYFTAATLFSKAFYAGTDVNSIAPIPYWENLFPSAAGVDTSNALFFGSPYGYCGAGAPPANPTATQSMYELYSCQIGPSTFGETNASNIFDANCFPACVNLNGVDTPFAYYSPQYTALYAWSSLGSSSYHAAQLVLRSRQKHGLQFDLNYSYSRSIDVGSDAERVPTFGGLGGAGAIINTWNPRGNKGDSDFDLRHSINGNWVYDLPFGKGKAYGGDWGRMTDSFLGGWELTGLVRWSSGFPFTVGVGGTFPTNFQLPGFAVQNGSGPATGKTIVAGNPFVFKQAGDPNLVNAFRFAFPGETGQRNNFRGDGYFGLDIGVNKIFHITERQSLKFSAEAFNVTNSVRFDVQSLNVNIQNAATFGQYGGTLTSPRVMQFALRYSF